MKVKQITQREHTAIALNLERYASKLFADMWKVHGPMVFSDEFDTAALELENGQFRVNANPKFWKRCSEQRRVFIICHEFLHLIFGHWAMCNGFETEWLNIAQDIQVNEYIRKNYPGMADGFSDDSDASISSVFKDKASLVEPDRDYKYYYDLLMQCLK